MGDGWTHYGIGCGDVHVILNHTLSYIFKIVQYVSNMNKNIMYVSEITKNPNFFVRFQGNKCMVTTLHDNKVVFVGIYEKGLYGY